LNIFCIAIDGRQYKTCLFFLARSVKIYDDVWVETENGLIPSNAVVGGSEDESAEASYFGVQISSFYQVLTNLDQKQKFKWMPTDGKSILEEAFLAGKEEGNNIYVGRLFHSSDSILIGQFNPSQDTLFFTHEGYQRRLNNQFEVLCVC